MRTLALLAAIATAAPALASPYQASVRVTFDRKHIRVTEAQGPAATAGRMVTADDPVRVASISKLITALGVMRLVEAGKLDLDRVVSEVLGWKLRPPKFPDVPITLRLLLSHRSGLTDGGELYLIPLGDTVRARLSDPRVWDMDHAPGTFFRYTNLNFPVVASVMETATGERFDRLMTRLVFVPLKLDACFNWSGCSPTAIAHAVTLRGLDGAIRRDDLKGQPPACLVFTRENEPCDLTRYRPGENGALFSPQGGVRISARGLARIGQLFLRGGEGFLTPQSLATLSTPQWRKTADNGVTGEGSDGGFFCAYGLAMQTLANPAAGCKDDPFGDGRLRIGHSGDAYGLKSGLWIDAKRRRRGVAYYATAVADEPGNSAFTATEERLAQGR